MKPLFTIHSYFAIFFCLICTQVSSYAQLKRPAHIGFIYPISSNGLNAAEYSNHFSLHALVGISKEETGVCISGISSIIKNNSTGVVISGISNHIGGNVQGVQVAGIINTAQENTNGVQVAGIANVAKCVEGVQASGIVSLSATNANVQLSGIVNAAQETNVQIAGISNTSKNNSDVQISGLINNAQNAHTQIAGLINIAQKVKGVQIAGLINIAEESDYPIGIINIVKNGEKQIGITLDDIGNTMLGFRSGGRKLYGILAIGGNNFLEIAPYALQGGMGFRIPIYKALRLNVEGTSMANSDFVRSAYFKSSLNVLVGLKIKQRLEIVAGPSFNHLHFDRLQPDVYKNNYLWQYRSFVSVNSLYFGGMVGVNINF